jgi:predicted AAA+ superfamily ATPase
MRELPAYRKGKKRKPISSSKYYFFDTGVARQLQGRASVTPGTPEYGDAFETFIMNEVFAYSDYARPLNLSFWRTVAHTEVDLIIDDSIALEIKSHQHINPDDLKGLKAISEEAQFKRLICVSLAKRPGKSGNIEIFPYNEFLEMLWAGRL